MSDIVLRFYGGSGANWGETLDYEITDVLDYTITDESGYAIDKAKFKIEDIDHVYADNISPDYDAEVTVWRAYNKGDGKLISSGVVTKVVEFGSFIEVYGDGMNSLFKRRVVADYSLTGDGSLKFTDVLINATSGLIQGSGSGLLPSTDYQAFDLSTHVVAGSNLIPTSYELKYDNKTLYDVVVDVCKKDVGANSRHYDCYLFEMDDADETVTPTLATAGNAYKMCLYLKEKRSTASSTTLDGGDIDTSSISWTNQKGGEAYFNKVVIRGAFQEVNFCPIDKDWWTDAADPETDGIWTDYNCDISASGTGEKVGDYQLEMLVDASATQSWVNLNLDTAATTNSTYTPDGMSSTHGFILDFDKEQYIRFYVACNAELINELNRDNALYCAVLLWDENMIDTDDAVGRYLFGHLPLQFSSGQQTPLFGVPTTSDWYAVDLRLKDYIPADSHYLAAVSFYIGFDGAIADGDEVLHIDGVYLYERNYHVQGSATKAGVTSNFKELLIELPELQNDDLCEKIATEALKEQDVLQNGGVIPVVGMFRNSELRAGNTVEIAIDSLNLDVRAGADGATSFEIEKIVYSPNRQVLHVGRNFSSGEMAERMKARALASFSRLR